MEKMNTARIYPFPSSSGGIFDFLPSESSGLQLLSCLPEQFFTAAQQSEAQWNGERRLLFAVLQDAVACWFRNRYARSDQGRQLFHEIRDWFLEKDQQSLYAFESICIHLNLDAEYFRRGLFLWETACTNRRIRQYWAERGCYPPRLLRRRS